MNVDFKGYIRNWPVNPRSDLTTVVGAACLHIAPRVRHDSVMADCKLHWVIEY